MDYLSMDPCLLGRGPEPPLQLSSRAASSRAGLPPGRTRLSRSRLRYLDHALLMACRTRATLESGDVEGRAVAVA